MNDSWPALRILFRARLVQTIGRMATGRRRLYTVWFMRATSLVAARQVLLVETVEVLSKIGSFLGPCSQTTREF